jgi:hypothetical protein
MGGGPTIMAHFTGAFTPRLTNVTIWNMLQFPNLDGSTQSSERGGLLVLLLLLLPLCNPLLTVCLPSALLLRHRAETPFYLLKNSSPAAVNGLNYKAPSFNGKFPAGWSAISG